MAMVDRIMKAFVQRTPLTAKQEAMVRAEVTAFAEGLLTKYKDALSQRQALIEKRD